ncbi:MAG: hypothetical protein ACFCUR_07490 [Rhodomicrobiaceae bacterium]
MIHDFGFGLFLCGTADFPQHIKQLEYSRLCKQGLSAWVIGWPMSSQRLTGLLLYYRPSFKKSLLATEFFEDALRLACKHYSRCALKTWMFWKYRNFFQVFLALLGNRSYYVLPAHWSW